MIISDFLSRHPGQDLAYPNEIIPISFQSRCVEQYRHSLSGQENTYSIQELQEGQPNQQKYLQYGY